MQQKPGRQELVALGSDGEAKPGWTPWTVPTSTFSPIVAAPDGHVYTMSYSADGQDLIVLRSDGSLERSRVLDFSAWQMLETLVCSSAGTIYVSTFDPDRTALLGTTEGHLSAFGPDGSAIPGWPVSVDGPNTIYLSPDGSIWTTWKIWNPSQQTGMGIAAFDTNGKLRAGFPMEAPADLNGALVFGPTGTAYVIQQGRQNWRLIEIAP